MSLTSSGFGKRRGGKEKKGGRGGTQRGEGEEKKEETKSKTHQQVVPPPGGGTCEAVDKVPPPLLMGGLRQLLAGSPRRGHASPDRNPENQAIPKEMQSWKSVKQNSSKIGVFFAKSGGPYRFWKSQDDLVQKFSPFLAPPWDFEICSSPQISCAQT